MAVIITSGSTYFTLNGIEYARIFQPLKQGENEVGIYNIYDVKQQLVNSTHYTEYTIDGNTYGSQAATISALLPIIYAPNTGSGGGSGVWGEITGTITSQTDLVNYVAANDDNDYTTSASFNTSNGIITFTRLSGGTYNVDLDGRYLTSETDSQTLSFNTSTGQLTISNGNTVELDGRYSLTGHTHTIGEITDFTDNSTNWDTAYSWGDHSTVGYLTGYTDTNDDDFTTGATFNTGDGIITFTRLSGGTYTVDLDGRYALNSHTHTVSDITDFPTNISYFTNDVGYLTGSTAGTDDFTTGATFNSGNGIIEFTRQSGGTYSVDISAYSGGTGGSNTDDYTTGATFNTGTGVIEFTRQSGSTYTVDIDGRYLESVQDDTSPTLGGNLVLNNNDITGTGNIDITGDISVLSGDTIINYSDYYFVGNSSFFPFGATNTIGVRMGNSSTGVDGNSSEIDFRRWTGTANLHHNAKIAQAKRNGVGNWGMGIYNSVNSTNSSASALTMFFTADNQVGVGTNNPQYKLDVNGDVFADSFIVDGGTSDDVLLGDGTLTSLNGIINADVDDYTTSASFNTGDGVITFNRLSGGTYTVDIDGRYSLNTHNHTVSDITDFPSNVSYFTNDVGYLTGYTDTNDDDYTTSASFNTGNGIITFNRLSGGTYTVDIDGRFALSSHNHTVSDITDFPSNVSYFTNDAGYLTGYTDSDDYVNGASFNTTNGFLRLERLSGDTVNVDLDGRYLTGISGDTNPQLSANLNLNGNQINGSGSINVANNITGNTMYSNAFVLFGGTSDEILLGDGTTAPTSSFTGSTDADTVDGYHATAFLFAAGTTTKTDGILRFNTNAKAQFGTLGNSDLYSNGSNTLLDLKIGDFIIQNNGADYILFDKDTGTITSQGFILSGGTSDDVLLGDGTTTSLAGITGLTAGYVDYSGSPVSQSIARFGDGDTIYGDASLKAVLGGSSNMQIITNEDNLDLVSANGTFATSAAIRIDDGSGQVTINNADLVVETGSLVLNALSNAATDYDRFLVYNTVGNNVQYRTGSQILSDLGITDNDVFVSGATFNTGDGVITYTNTSGGTFNVDIDGRYLQNVLEDTSPQLGGNLDLNSNNITGTGNINITGTFTGNGSGLTNVDADTFDTLNSTQFLRADVATTKTNGNLVLNDNIRFDMGTGSDFRLSYDSAGNYAQFVTDGTTAMRFSNTSTGQIGILNNDGSVELGGNLITPRGHINFFDNNILGGTAGNSINSFNIETAGGSGGNQVRRDNHFVRDAAGTNWTTVRVHDSLSVDGSFLTPQVNTKTFWERDPNSGYQYFGQNANYVLTINCVNQRVGIKQTNPSYELDVNGDVFAKNLIKDGATSDDILLGDGSTTSLADLASLAQTLSNKTSNYSIVSTDVGDVITTSGASNIDITVNTGSLTNVGESVEVDALGTGTVTIVAGTATLRYNSNDTLVLDGQYSRVQIQKISSTEYRVFGQLTPA